MAQGITEQVVEDIKTGIDLAELISSYGIEVRRAGSSMKACCPFHHEKTPSFNINTAKGFYHCFGCGESGDAIKFVQKMEGLSFVEAVKKLAERCGIKIEEKADPEAGGRKRLYALMGELAQFYHRCLDQTKEAAPAREYLASRDLGSEVQDDFLIGYAPNGIAHILTWAQKHGFTTDELAAAGVIKPPSYAGDRGYHRFGGRLMFSIKDRQGRVVAFSGRQLVASRNSGKYVNSPETAIFKKSRVLFGFDRAAANIARNADRQAIVCEGQIDTIRLHICGFPVAVASQGTAFTEEHVKMLGKVADSVVLVFDDDAAGHKATIRTAGLFLAADMRVKVVRLPGGEDPDSFLRTRGADEFRRLLDGAESIVDYQVAVERAKEKDPTSGFAVTRIVKAVLNTIAMCENAVEKEAMAGRLAKLMGLSTAAVREELAKVRVDRTAFAEAVVEEEIAAGNEREIKSIEGADARAVAPPPASEMEFMEFLLANERNTDIDAKIGEFLPEKVFIHPFTARFVGIWRAEVQGGNDEFAAFGKTLEEPERGWFSSILVHSGRTQSSNRRPEEMIEEYIVMLWTAHLRYWQGMLPAVGDAAADEKMRISMVLKSLRLARWGKVKDIIRDIMKGEY